MSQQLSSDFLIELAKSCILNADLVDVIKPHLQYSFISQEPVKQVFKYIFDHHTTTGKSPTIGLLSQNNNSREALDIIAKIREANVHGNKDEIVGTFESFIKKARFIDLHHKTAELWSADKNDQALQLMERESAAINSFSLKNKLHRRIYADFNKRQLERQSRDFTTIKVPTGIPQFDYHTRGGIDRGTGLLGIARSGVGKTTFLRSLGYHASFRGINVLHLAGGDSTTEEIENGYDGMWTGVDLHLMREGKLGGADINKINKAKQAFLAQCGEIFIHVFQQFHSASIADCRNVLIELLKEHDIGLVLFDLLESFEPGDGKKYSTGQDGTSARKKATSEKIINIATEFNIAVAAVTQASDIPKAQWDDPNFVITRNNISNLRATVDPFAYCVTLNQTEGENDNEIMRIHEEKLRHYKIFSWSSTYHIAQKRDVGRFIDVAETNARFWDVENKKIIKDKPKEVSTPVKKNEK